MIKCIEHVAIAAQEPKKLADWYVRNLNFSFVRQIGPTVYIRDPRGVTVEFVPAESLPLPPQMRDRGLRHIAFEVDDIERTYATLSASGVEFVSGPISMEGMQLHFFQDMEGNFLHLVQRDRPL